MYKENLQKQETVEPQQENPDPLQKQEEAQPSEWISSNSHL